MKTLRDIGEDALIERLVALVPRDADPAAAPGDDCAVIDPGPDSPTLLLLKTDALVERVHFLSSSPARAVGWKAVARVISDFAAMGGKPGHFLITLALPPETPVAWAEDLYRGIGDCLEKFGGTVAGGETSSVPSGSAAVISVAATGSVRREQLVLRATANPGDLLFVTGLLGGSIQGKHLAFTPRVHEAEWLVACFKPTAMMDLSDGIAKDLPRMAAASHCGYRVDEEKLPLTPGSTAAQALGDGEDFELLFAIEAALANELLEAWPFPGLPLTCIGKLVESGKGQSLTGGWEHFSNPKSRGWYSRGYLPHMDVAGEIQAITFRLADALPKQKIEHWKRELAAGSAGLETGGSDSLRARELREQIARYEDAGHGCCLLRSPEHAKTVQDALLHFDGERYRLLEWCIMPNHVHVIIQPAEGHLLDRIVKSWKTFTARKIHESTGDTGPLWQRDYHDRYIRDLDHLASARAYVRHNPVKAGLCASPEEWPWSSAGSAGLETGL